MPSFDITPLARKYAPWSFSKIEAAQACPAQFNFKHLARAARGAATSDNKVGTVAHSILERRVLGDTRAVARQHALAKDALTTAELESLCRLDDSIEAFLKRFDAFCQAQGVIELWCEKAWAIDDQHKPVAFRDPAAYFKGQLDLCALTRARDLFIIDHKAGSAKPLHNDQAKQAQLQTYAVLATANIPNLAGVRGGIHFLQGNEALRLQWAAYMPYERIQRLYVPWLYQHVNAAAANLVAPFEARPAKKWPCAWCPYQQYCEPYNTYMEPSRGA